MIAALVIAFSGTQNSGAGEPLSTNPSAAKAAPEHCPGVRKALRFYTKRWQHWTSLRTGAGSTTKPRRLTACPRYLLKIRQAKALAAHKAWNRYFDYHYAWAKWMPEKLQRVGACETGYGKRPGSFTWDSGTYVSFAGIIRVGFNYFASRIGVHRWPDKKHPGPLPTPREQVLVTLALQARYGWGAWGCGGA